MYLGFKPDETGVFEFEDLVGRALERFLGMEESEDQLCRELDRAFRAEVSAMFYHPHPTKGRGALFDELRAERSRQRAQSHKQVLAALAYARFKAEVLEEVNQGPGLAQVNPGATIWMLDEDLTPLDLPRGSWLCRCNWVVLPHEDGSPRLACNNYWRSILCGLTREPWGMEWAQREFTPTPASSATGEVAAV